MKRTLRILLNIVLAVVIPLVLIVAVAIAYLNLAPRSGKPPHGKHLERVIASPNYHGDRFVNTVTTGIGNGEGSMVNSLKRWLFERDARSPRRPLPTGWQTPHVFTPVSDSGITVTWFGHSTALVQFEGKNILLDPMFSNVSSPFPIFGKRFATDAPLPVDALPDLDVVVISHDHYDHLDYESILKIQDKTVRFVVSLGLASHLEYWGVPSAKITELDWWQSAEFDSLFIAATPARHFSGRRRPQANNTLWSSWVIKGAAHALFFSGDGGHSDQFKEIGRKYGPFDIALMECGQYNQAWADIHMMPEETVLACLDVGGKLLMPIHWGAFDLSLHSWKEPPTRLTAEAHRLNVPLALPLIGEKFDIASPPTAHWWDNLDESAD
jgi:L-ascorbate metabolism protein UlaG (beta-lactamase superfamily)